MARHCMLTGAIPRFGKQVSHSNRRSARRFDPNLQTKRYWVPSEHRYVRLQLSAKAIKAIDRIGIDAALARIRARGEQV